MLASQRILSIRKKIRCNLEYIYGFEKYFYYCARILSNHNIYIVFNQEIIMINPLIDLS